MVSRSCAATLCVQLCFSKMVIVLESSCPCPESAQSLSGFHPDCLSSSPIVCPSLGQFPEGLGLPLSALVPRSGTPNERHAVQLCAGTPLWQEAGQ